MGFGESLFSPPSLSYCVLWPVPCASALSELGRPAHLAQSTGRWIYLYAPGLDTGWHCLIPRVGAGEILNVKMQLRLRLGMSSIGLNDEATLSSPVWLYSWSSKIAIERFLVTSTSFWCGGPKNPGRAPIVSRSGVVRKGSIENPQSFWLA